MRGRFALRSSETGVSGHRRSRPPTQRMSGEAWESKTGGPWRGRSVIVGRVEMSEAERRVWRRLPGGAAEAIAGLSGSQLQALLLWVPGDGAGAVRPADRGRRWRQDRFVRPAAA